MEHSGLSFDIMHEILSRTPLKTMASCRLLSQDCNSLSYEPHFMDLHCERTNTIAGYFIQTLSFSYYYSTFVSVDNPSLSSEFRLDFLPDYAKMKILGCADGGLMLIENLYSREEYYVCKPSTKEFVTIPKPHPSSITNKIALMVLALNPLRFKVVRLFKPDYDDENEDLQDPEHYHSSLRRYNCEVFNSDTWAWKRLKDEWLPYSELLYPNQAALSAYGGLHWLNGSQKNILSFYEDKESWKLVPLPKSLNFSKAGLPCVTIHCLTKYEGKLGVVCDYENRDTKSKIVELWILTQDSNGEKSWSKRQVLDLATCDREIRGCCAVSFYNSDALLMTGFGYLIFYNCKTGQVKRVELDAIYKYEQDVVFLQTDREPLNLKQPTKVLH